MNIENLFVRTADQAAVANVVERCLSQVDQPEWELPSSYAPLLAKDPKRKVAISPVIEGWIAIIESKEVVDFGMAKSLADELGCTAFIMQVSDSTGAVGHLSYSNGQVTDSQFDEEAADPLNEARDIVKRHGIPFDLKMFREVVPLTTQGWLLKQRR